MTKTILLCDLACTYAKCDNRAEITAALKSALECARSVKAGNLSGLGRNLSLLSVAEAQAKVEEIEAAKATLQEAVEQSWSISDAGQRTVVLRDIARAQAGVGDVLAADTTLEEALRVASAAADVPDPGLAGLTAGTKQAVALAAVAEAMAEIGKIDRAMQVAQSIRDDHKVSALARIGAGPSQSRPKGGGPTND